MIFVYDVYILADVKRRTTVVNILRTLRSFQIGMLHLVMCCKALENNVNSVRLIFFIIIVNFFYKTVRRFAHLYGAIHNHRKAT